MRIIISSMPEKEQDMAVNLRAEFKPLLSAVTISIEMGRSVVSMSPRLEVKNHSISLTTKCWSTSFKLENITLKPSSCRNLHWLGTHGLQLTMMATWRSQVSNAGDADSNFKDNMNEMQNASHPFNQDFLVTRIQERHPHCYCVGCGVQILNTSCKFKRVLPLPSENWSDFADIWFCHNHSNGHSHGNHHHSSLHSGTSLPKTNHDESTIPEQLQQVRNTGILPRQDDCLVSSLYMMISALHVNPNSVTCSIDKLICKRCGNFLGFVKLGDASAVGKTLKSYLSDPLNGVYKIYFHTVTFGAENRNIGPPMLKVPFSDFQKGRSNLQEQSVEDFICGFLKDQSRVFTSFRFILHSSPFRSSGQPGVDILLWLLDQELYLYNSTCDTQDSVDSKPEMRNEKIVFMKSPSSDNDRSHGMERDLTDAMANLNLKPTRHMKILYKADIWPANDKHQSTQPDVFRAWQKDNTVHGLTLPYALCQQILSLLIASTSKLNVYQRSLNGFHVGFLRAS